MENMENKMQTTELSPREEYHQEFLPQVHKIGATTMAIALILSLLPTIYFVFIKGIEVPLSTFISVMIAIFTFAIGMWLSEPAAFWPVLGSAGTYFAFLAGNASSMRLPVALTARSSPVRPISPMAARSLGTGLSRKLEAKAIIAARSAAGSSSERPPITFT